MQVTVQNVPDGSGRIIAARASGEASIPPGTPKTRLMRSGGGRMPSSSQRIALTTWPTSNASTSSAMPACVARSMIPRPAAGGVMNVSSPKFIEPDSTPEMSGCASRPVVRSSIVMSLLPPVETMVSSSLPARMRSITSLNSSGPAARRAVVLAHVQVDDGRPASAASMLESAISAVVYGMFGLFSRNTSAPVTATVSTAGLLFQLMR